MQEISQLFKTHMLIYLLLSGISCLFIGISFSSSGMTNKVMKLGFYLVAIYAVYLIVKFY